MNIDAVPNDDWIRSLRWTATRTETELNVLISDVRRSRRTARMVSRWASYPKAPQRLREAVETALS